MRLVPRVLNSFRDTVEDSVSRSVVERRRTCSAYSRSLTADLDTEDRRKPGMNLGSEALDLVHTGLIQYAVLLRARAIIISHFSSHIGRIVTFPQSRNPQNIPNIYFASLRRHVCNPAASWTIYRPLRFAVLQKCSCGILCFAQSEMRHSIGI